MKKYFVLFTALTACIIISCNKEIKDSPIDNTDDIIATTPVGRTVTIMAECEPGTKTFYDGGTDFSWTVGDKISVLTYNSSTDDYKYKDFVADKTASASTFTGTLDDGYELSNIALFPASDDHGYDSGDYYPISFNIPQYKDCVSHESADLPMVAEKSGDVYAFKHCSGAAKITIDNIPAKYTSVTISFTTTDSGTGVILSGTFNTRKRSSGFFAWDPDYASTDDERNFTRKVPVTSNSATVYLPFATGGSIYSGNTLTVTGHDGVNNDVIYSNTAVKSLGSFSRATITPLATLHINKLRSIDWSSVTTSVTSDGNYKELKVDYDPYFVYFHTIRNRNDELWGSSGYIYYMLDTDSSTSTGGADPNNSSDTGYDSIFYFSPYAGTASPLAPDFKTTLSASVSYPAETPSFNAADFQGSYDASTITLNFAVKRENARVSNGDNIRLVSYGNKSLSKATVSFIIND